MRNRFVFSASILALALALAFGCDRKIEPFDPNEQPSEPNLSKIFPEGAERAEQQPPSLPPAPGETLGAAAPAAVGAASAGDPIRGTVELAPSAEGRVPAGAVLFIIGRRPGGGPPFAVKRVAELKFPLSFSLGPEDRMTQATPFSGPIHLTARVDSDGNASSRTPGDLQGKGVDGPFQPGATGAVILLDTVL